MFTDWNFWLSIITAGSSLTAILLTLRQMRLSNKQHLFDKRIENYDIVKGLVQLYKNNQSLLSEFENGPVSVVELIFNSFTNNTYLHNLAPAITKPLENPGHKELHIKLENLKEVATKTKFLFKNNTATYIRDFVLAYNDLLFTMYLYRIVWYKAGQANESEPAGLDVYLKRYQEEPQRKKLIKAIKDIKQAYDKLDNQNVMEKIEKQIKL